METVIEYMKKGDEKGARDAIKASKKDRRELLAAAAVTGLADLHQLLYVSNCAPIIEKSIEIADVLIERFDAEED
jgi:hypothetical protein